MTKPIWKLEFEDKNKVLELINNLEFFRNKFIKWDRIRKREEFFCDMEEFLSFVADFNNKRVFSIFEHSEYYSQYKQYFSYITKYYLRTLQVIGALNMAKNFNKNVPLLSYLNSEYSKNIYDKTITDLKLIDINKYKNVYVVDTWANSATTFAFYLNTSIKKIIWLCNSHEAAYLAEEAFRKLNNNRLEFLYNDWKHIEYAKADLVYLINFTTWKKKILDKIAETSWDDITILARAPIQLWKMIFENPLKGLHPRLTVIHKGVSSKRNNYQIILLKKLNI